MFQNNLLMAAASISAGGITVDDSVRYNDDDSPRLYRTPTSVGGRRTGSISFWYKRCNLGSIQQLFNAGSGDDITFNASDQLTFTDSSGVNYITTQVFRDPTAWGNLLFAWDTTLAAAGDRLRIYHNGVEITAFDTETNPDQFDQFEISNTVRQTIGANESDTEEFDGYFSQFYYVDGQQLTPSDFGETDNNGVWRPITFAGGGSGIGADAIPTMTSNTAPSGVASATFEESAGYAAWKAFDKDNSTYWSNYNNGVTDSLQYQFTSAKTISHYLVMPRASSGRTPTAWTFQGSNNGSDWTTLDTITGQSMTGGAFTIFACDTTGSYTYYKWAFTASTDTNFELFSVEMLEASSGYGTNGFFLDFADSSDFGLDAAGDAVSTTTYRYLRMNSTAATSTTYVGIGEMEYFVGDTLYPTQTMTGNSAPSPLVASANVETVGTEAFRAFDDSKHPTISKWQANVNTNTTPSFLKIDLGSGNGIAATSFAIFAPETQDRTPTQFTIQGSNDDSDYTILGSFGTGTWASQEERSWVLSNANNFLSSGLAANDQVNDTPTKNYPTWATNVGRYASGVGPANTISNGNLDLLGGEGAYSFCDINFTPLTSGKWYWTQLSNTIYDVNLSLGIVNEANRSNGIPSQSYYSAVGAWSLGWAGPPTPADQIQLSIGGASGILGDLSPVPTAGAQMVLAVDIDNLKIWAGWWDDDNDNLYWMASDASFSSANVDVPATGSSETASLVGTGFTLFTQNYSTRGGVIDFGSVNGGILSNITQPSGFLELNTANLATPTILDGTAHFQPTLYTGDGSVRSIDQTENSTFQPDMVWIKNRSAADLHSIFDATRGVTKYWATDTHGIEVTNANTLTSFDSDGFGLGTGAGGWNDNTENFVAWQWLSGGGAGSSNEEGSINTTTTTVNTTNGISISTFTGNATSGATIGHGLGAAPEFMIDKPLTGGHNGATYLGSLGAHYGTYLDLPNTPYDNVIFWNDTAPTSSLITFGSGVTNVSSVPMIIYAFAPIDGFSKFGKYIGNGLADGTYVYTGFKPAFVMIKKTSGTGSWVMYDSQRSPYNEIDDQLVADTAAAETTGSEELDFLSNGFKIRTTDSDVNTSSGIYFFAAFAEYPFGGDGATPATAF